MEENGPDAKKKNLKHDSGAADLERVTDYAEEKEISSDVTGAIATLGEKRRKEAQEKLEREIELSKVSIKKEDVELMGPVDTAAVADAVLCWLTDNKIHHTVFARSVLGWNSAFSPLIRKPAPWHEADERSKRAYLAMQAWLRRPHNERLDTVRVRQNQMNRKRKTPDTKPAAPAGGPAPPAVAQPAALSPCTYPGAEYTPMGTQQQYMPGYSDSQPALTSLVDTSSSAPQQAQSQYSEFNLADMSQPQPPPSYQDSVQGYPPGSANAPDRPPPLYSAPLPGYEELSRSYGPAMVQQQTAFTQLPSVNDMLQQEMQQQQEQQQTLRQNVMQQPNLQTSGLQQSSIPPLQQQSLLQGSLQQTSPQQQLIQPHNIQQESLQHTSLPQQQHQQQLHHQMGMSQQMMLDHQLRLQQQREVPAPVELQQRPAPEPVPPLQPVPTDGLSTPSPATSGEPATTPAKSAARPPRVTISPLQRRALVDIFHVTQHPSQPMRQLIASTLDLPQRTVTNFFSAARTRSTRKARAEAAAAAAAGAGAPPGLSDADSPVAAQPGHTQLQLSVDMFSQNKENSVASFGAPSAAQMMS